MGKISANAFKKNFIENRFFIIFSFSALILMGIVALYSFVTSPFAGDIKVFFAAANQVKYQNSSGLMAVFESWELKGIANRLLIYLIYLAANFFVGFENKIAFECAAKLIYAILILVILAVSAYLLPIKNNKKIIFFVVSFFLFFASNVPIHLQAEMTCMALCILSFSCILSGKLPLIIFAGFIGSLLFFFKSIFILLFASVLICVVLYNEIFEKPHNKKTYALPCVFTVGFELVLSLIVLLVYPQEFKDMLSASDYQSTLLSENSSVTVDVIINRFSFSLIKSIVIIPILVLGVIAFVLLIISFVKSKKRIALISLISLWVISADIIIVSNNYFQYHYFLLALPSLVSIALFLKQEKITVLEVLISAVLSFGATCFCWIAKDGLNQISIINNSTVLLVFLHLILFAVIIFSSKKFVFAKNIYTVIAITVSLFFWMNYSSFIAPYYRNVTAIERNTEKYNQQTLPSNFSTEKVLYLDGGMAPFYLDAPSYSKYFFNLPLQRASNKDEWDTSKEQYQLLMNYDGKYIVYSDWFNVNKYPEFKDKLNNEYEPLENGKLYFHSPSYDVFILNETNISSADIQIYVRKGS